LQSLPGVANLDIDADAKTVVVMGDPEVFDLTKAQSALDDCGFPAEETTPL
jgi:copper chaperone CopZ